jgi:hypothetical protein
MMDSLPKGSDPARYGLTDPVTPEPPGRIAVVIQGPVLGTDDFTLETVRLYRHVCPDMTVILSTWDNSPVEIIQRCREAGADVVLSRLPAGSGRGNVNYQATSARAGIQRAGELGAQFVAKTRSDQRLYGVHCLYGLPALLAAFPTKPGSDQVARLVTSTFHTFKYLPLVACDHFMFGAVPDMLAFWSPPIDTLNRSQKEINRESLLQTTVEGKSRDFVERYLMTEFLRKKNEHPAYTILAWWRVLADRFMVIEWSQLDAYWPKYCPIVARRDVHMNVMISWVRFSFADWVRLVSTDPSDWRPPEQLLDLPPDTAPPVRLCELPQSG